MSERELSVGVVGVGSMGENHARVYSECPELRLAGVVDRDSPRAAEVAAKYGTESTSLEKLLSEVDAVSICVPTRHHYAVASDCLEAGVDVLVEKPYVLDRSEGEELIELADANDALIQVGHIERFNPAVQALFDILQGVDPIAVTARRLGPPTDRQIDDSVVFDLMIHDIDIVLALFGEEPTSIAGSTRHDGQYASAQLEFSNGIIGTLVSSRVTQQKVRQLEVTAESCHICLDFIDQSIQIHRQSHPEYTQEEGGLRYRHESVTERPMIESGEPLKLELESFVGAVRDRTDPVVTPEDALRALWIASEIEGQSQGQSVPEVMRP
ncbi:MAG: Gfo/Idh/MocA family oxidoreductase [Haloferacaceae archaeon]